MTERCIFVAGFPDYSVVIGVVRIHCLMDALVFRQSSAPYVRVNYALLKEDSCVTFQSFGDDAETCSYTLNYVQQGLFNLENRRYSTRMKIQYYTYLRQAIEKPYWKQDNKVGVLIVMIAPQNSDLQFYDLDTYMEYSVR